MALVRLLGFSGIARLNELFLSMVQMAKGPTLATELCAPWGGAVVGR